LTLSVSSSIAILRQHRMDRRLLNPKIARRALSNLEKRPSDPVLETKRPHATRQLAG
jgi:hypothetical protein